MEDKIQKDIVEKETTEIIEGRRLIIRRWGIIETLKHIKILSSVLSVLNEKKTKDQDFIEVFEQTEDKIKFFTDIISASAEDVLGIIAATLLKVEKNGFADIDEATAYVNDLSFDEAAIIASTIIHQNFLNESAKKNLSMAVKRLNLKALSVG